MADELFHIATLVVLVIPVLAFIAVIALHHYADTFKYRPLVVILLILVLAACLSLGVSMLWVDHYENIIGSHKG
jgi:glucose-6-phosphate-specific signal transduction histidine kinase